MEEKINRRHFHKQAGSLLFATGAFIPLTMLNSCSSDDNPAGPSDNDSGDTKINLDEFPTLQSVGGVATTTINSKPVAIIRTGDASYITLSRVCTHQGCTVSYTTANSRFDCPCHGSRFDKNGNVLQGPAAQKLESFATTLDSETQQLTISI